MAMPIVTGDRYLDSLVKFVDNHADSLIEGTLVLKLNPIGLRYVQSRFEALAELESLLAGAPVDYLRAYVSDLGDHRALEQLRRILRLLPSLKVVSVLPLGRDPTPLYLLPFGRLKVLELRGCDLSTSAAKGLLELRVTLEKLICHDSTDALRHVFASRIADIKDSHQWNRLSFVSCACNGLVLMDESLQLLPAVEDLDLSRNKFATVDNLRKCTKLKHLDLGYNNLRSITSFSEVSCQIVKLVLRNNALTSLRGIENLKSLQGLDLSYNIISNFSEIEILAGFSSLQNLWLEGNPICCARWFRPQVFSLFYQPDQVKLDEKKMSTSEYWKRQIIIASREKQPASFGFYFPVHDDADTPGNVNTKRKRISRIVNIEDNEQGTSSDLDSPSCDNQSQSRDENPNPDQEAEIEDLVTRIEFLKKDRSVLWLQEFKEWMNRTFENSVDGNKVRSTIFDKSYDNHLKNLTNDGDLAESSRNIYDSFRLSGDESSSVILESETSFADTSTGVGSQRYIDQIGGSTSISFMGQDEGGGILFKHLNLDEHFLFNNAANLFGDAGEFNSHEGPTEEHVITEHFTSTSSALNDVSGSYASSAYPGSPPHYQEDILQRRHNLEEEILQLSAESFSLASSDSNTSCSEDDCEVVSHSVAEVDQSGIDISPEGRHNGFFKDSHCVDVGKSYVDNILALKANGTNTVRQYAEGKFVRTDIGELQSGSLSNVLHGDEGIGFGKGRTDFLEKMKLRRKSRRRMVSLPEEEDVHGDTDSSRKSADHVNHSRSDMSHEGQVGCCSSEVLVSPLARNCEDGAATTPNAGKDDFIVTYFNSSVASPRVNETCGEYVQCHCLLVEGSEYNEREVAILRSSEQKLYVLVDDACDGSGTGLKMIGCHQVSNVKQVFVGLGLQVVRIYFEGDDTYLFITRCMWKSRKLLWLLNIFDSSGMKNICPLTSLEQIQFNCFVEYLCGESNINLLQYSMVLLGPKILGENLWLPRSLFVLEGYLVLCAENLMEFGPSANAFSPQYLLLDSCCAIIDVSKMVIETQDNPCITLTLKGTSEFPPSEKVPTTQDRASLKKKSASDVTVWKLKWFSIHGLFNFVALMKAIHPETISSPLIIEYPSRANSV